MSFVTLVCDLVICTATAIFLASFVNFYFTYVNVGGGEVYHVTRAVHSVGLVTWENLVITYNCHFPLKYILF